MAHDDGIAAMVTLLAESAIILLDGDLQLQDEPFQPQLIAGGPVWNAEIFTMEGRVFRW